MRRVSLRRVGAYTTSLLRATPHVRRQQQRCCVCTASPATMAMCRRDYTTRTSSGGGAGDVATCAPSSSSSPPPQHEPRRRLTAMERVELLCDDDTFRERGALVEHHNAATHASRHVRGDGVVTGTGRIFGRPVYVYAHDARVQGGALSPAGAGKIVRLMDEAAHAGVPLVSLCESAGARVHDGVDALAAVADIFVRNTLYSGVVPQLSLVLGACAGAAAYSAALTDFTFMVDDTSYLFVTGPEVLRAASGHTHTPRASENEDDEVGDSNSGRVVTKEQLGGSVVHTTRSGVCAGSFANELVALAQLRRFYTYLPLNNRHGAPMTTTTTTATHVDTAPCLRSDDRCHGRADSLDRIVPASATAAYDMHDVIDAIVDAGSFFEVAPAFARNVLCGFARMDGRSVCVVANQPCVLAGALDGDAAVKAARLVRFADAFQLPIVTLVDVPGFLPGVAQEHGGILRHGAKLLYAYAEATVPKLTVVTRKAYGGAYDVMASQRLRADCTYAWPHAEIAVMGDDAACALLFRHVSSPEERARRSRAYAAASAQTAGHAARSGLVDAVIAPHETRRRLCEDLQRLQYKQQSNPWRKHDNMPL